MKTKLIMAIPMLCFLLMSVTPFKSNQSKRAADIQDLKITGVYDGNEGYGYNFIAQHKDSGSDFTMTFKHVNEAVMKEFDLDEDVFLNQKFEITYNTQNVITKDDDGFDQEEEVHTITNLKSL